MNCQTSATGPVLVRHVFNPSLRRQRQADLCQCQVILVYKVSFKTARAVTQRNTVSKNQTKPTTTKPPQLQQQQQPQSHLSYKCQLLPKHSRFKRRLQRSGHHVFNFGTKYCSASPFLFFFFFGPLNTARVIEFKACQGRAGSLLQKTKHKT